MNQETYDEYCQYVSEMQYQEEAYYYSVIRDAVDIIKQYGMPIVMKDIIKVLTKDEQSSNN